MYQYKANITRVIDGDTVIANIDLGFYTSIMKQKLRLLRIDAPSLKEDSGVASKAYLESMILNKDVMVDIKKSKDKYGRWLAEIYLDGESTNSLMLENGFATLKQ